MMSPRMTFRMEKAEGNIGELYIYDAIENSSVSYDGTVIESETDANIIREKLEAMGDITELRLYISSNGGDVKTGLAIYSQLKRMSCKKVAYIDGFAFSIASVIPMACDEVIMYPTSLLMVHNASAWCFGNAEAHRKFADDLDTISASAVTAYLDKAGEKLDKDTLTELLNAETYLSAEDCLKYGLCDRIDSNSSRGNTDVSGSSMYADAVIVMQRLLADEKRLNGSDPQAASKALHNIIARLNSETAVSGKSDDEPVKDKPQGENTGNTGVNITDKSEMIASAFINSLFK